ncbi:MAG: hypothetical protein EXS35_01925 [Pedosphaera sp.]|nr:hypothetical protein [Pedosphaera sp.]
MKKILLGLIVLGIGGGVFLAAHRSTKLLRGETRVARESWMTQTQSVAHAQRAQIELVSRVRKLKQTLARSQAAAESALWSALKTNHARRFTPELRELLLEELGFNWRSAEEYIVVSKETLRDVSMPAVRRGKLSDLAATILAMTPEERGQVEAAIQRGQVEFKEWSLSHTERSEPKDDVVAQYTLTNDPAMSQSLSNTFAAGVFDALGTERAELLLNYASDWMRDIGVQGETTTMTVKRYLAGDEQHLNVQLQQAGGTSSQDVSPHFFPEVFRPLFPKGWVDLAKREGFELPKEFLEK